MVPFIKVGGKDVTQSAKSEQIFGTQSAFIISEAQRKVMLREINNLPKVICGNWQFVKVGNLHGEIRKMNLENTMSGSGSF